jgi:repressor LexA
MLTELESKIIEALRQHFARHTQAPTLEQLGQQVGLRSKGTVHRYINTLIEKGYLERTQQKGWRGIRLSEEASQGLHSLPLLGRIAAGQPIEAIPDQTELNLIEQFLGPGRYALQVKGDSMVDVGILDGDWAIILKSDRARSGEIVVALIDGEHATLKRLGQQSSDEIELIPENSTMSTMCYEPSRVQIQGILVGQMRNYPR